MGKIRALTLLSGGLDSLLATVLIKNQGADLTCLHFSNPFENKNAYPLKQANKLNIPYREVVLGTEFLDMLKNPRFGYGKNLNPCIDCRILMLKKAKNILRIEDYDCIVTGEVSGQRPMSQKNNTIQLIEREAGLKGKILRPLSAKNFKSTIVEKKGDIDRAKLLKISGRSRKRQLSLIQEFGFSADDYSTPAGGCKLTNIGYSRKVRDLMEKENKFTLRNIALLNLGRHFRTSEKFKIIVGKDQGENLKLEKFYRSSEIKMVAKNYKGPLCLGMGKFCTHDIKIMAKICGRYSNYPGAGKIKFNYYNGNIKREIKTAPFSNEKIENYRI
ncbi:MAG: tRNA 4-thiouridine(8) synthase ThiI [Elusimicrobiota bacterium]